MMMYSKASYQKKEQSDFKGTDAGYRRRQMGFNPNPGVRGHGNASSSFESKSWRSSSGNQSNDKGMTVPKPINLPSLKKEYGSFLSSGNSASDSVWNKNLASPTISSARLDVEKTDNHTVNAHDDVGTTAWGYKSKSDAELKHMKSADQASFPSLGSSEDTHASKRKSSMGSVSSSSDVSLLQRSSNMSISKSSIEQMILPWKRADSLTSAAWIDDDDDEDGYENLPCMQNVKTEQMNTTNLKHEPASPVLLKVDATHPKPIHGKESLLQSEVVSSWRDTAKIKEKECSENRNVFHENDKFYEYGKISILHSRKPDQSLPKASPTEIVHETPHHHHVPKETTNLRIDNRASILEPIPVPSSEAPDTVHSINKEIQQSIEKEFTLMKRNKTLSITEDQAYAVIKNETSELPDKVALLQPSQGIQPEIEEKPVQLSLQQLRETMRHLKIPEYTKMVKITLGELEQVKEKLEMLKKKEASVIIVTQFMLHNTLAKLNRITLVSFPISFELSPNYGSEKKGISSKSVDQAPIDTTLPLGTIKTEQKDATLIEDTIQHLNEGIKSPTKPSDEYKEKPNPWKNAKMIQTIVKADKNVDYKDVKSVVISDIKTTSINNVSEIGAKTTSTLSDLNTAKKNVQNENKSNKSIMNLKTDDAVVPPIKASSETIVPLETKQKDTNYSSKKEDHRKNIKSHHHLESSPHQKNDVKRVDKGAQNNMEVHVKPFQHYMNRNEAYFNHYHHYYQRQYRSYQLRAIQDNSKTFHKHKNAEPSTRHDANKSSDKKIDTMNNAIVNQNKIESKAETQQNSTKTTVDLTHCIEPLKKTTIKEPLSNATTEKLSSSYKPSPTHDGNVPISPRPTHSYKNVDRRFIHSSTMESTLPSVLDTNWRRKTTTKAGS